MCVVIVQRIFHMNFGTMTAKEIFQANDNILQAYENKLELNSGPLDTNAATG